MIKIDDSDVFFEIQKKFERIPFTQSEGWFNYVKCKGQKVVFFTDDTLQPTIALWGTEHSIPLNKRKILRIEGETIREPFQEKEIVDFYKQLIAAGYAGIEINSNSTYSIEYEIALRRAGFIKPMACFSCPLTLEIKLKEELLYSGNWKRNIKKGVKVELLFKEIVNISYQDIKIFVKMFNEMSMLKKLRYTLEINSILKLFKGRDTFRLFFVLDSNEEVIAARIVHIHNNYVTDVFAANSNLSRENGATFYLMDKILNLLKLENMSFFDFGRIPPSNHGTDSVYQFKVGSGGIPIQYNGEWVYYDSKIIESFVFMYKLFKQRKQRY